MTTRGVPATPSAHRLLLEKRWTRVWEMKLGPGETYPTHEHRYPYLSLISEGASLVLTGPDERDEALEVKRGDVIWGHPPDVHAVRNVGTTTFLSRLVEFLTSPAAPSAEHPKHVGVTRAGAAPR